MWREIRLRIAGRAIIADPFRLNVWKGALHAYPKIHRIMRLCYATLKRLPYLRAGNASLS